MVLRQLKRLMDTAECLVPANRMKLFILTLVYSDDPLDQEDGWEYLEKYFKHELVGMKSSI